jgi:hypothetical protein
MRPVYSKILHRGDDRSRPCGPSACGLAPQAEQGSAGLQALCPSRAWPPRPRWTAPRWAATSIRWSAAAWFGSRLGTSTSASASFISRPRGRGRDRGGPAVLVQGSGADRGPGAAFRHRRTRRSARRVSRFRREKRAGRSENAICVPDIQGIRAQPVLLKVERPVVARIATIA